MRAPCQDRRVRKTKAQIRRSLTQLLQERELKDITVSRLTELADLNRGTFYLHYKDIYDLFEQTENEILADFTAIIARYRKQEQMSLIGVLLEAFHFVEGNSDTLLALLKSRETTFLPRIVEMCRPQNKEEWEGLFPGGRKEDYEYYYSFISYGCIALLKGWFENGMKEPVEYMAAMAEKLMQNCAENMP